MAFSRVKTFPGVHKVIGFFIASGNILLYLTGEVCHSFILRLAGCGLLFTQGVLLVAELRSVGVDLKGLVQGEPRASSRRRRPGSIADYGATISGIARRLEWIEEIAGERVTSQKRGLSSDSARYAEFSEVCEHLIRDLGELRGPLEVVVLWSDEDQGHCLSSRGEDSRIGMVRNLLQAHLTMLASEPGSAGEGALLIDRGDFLGRLLTLQGFENANWWQLEADENYKAFLWCGYGEFGIMSLFERQIVVQAIERFRFNLSALRRLLVLSDRVDETSLISKQKDMFLSHFSHDVRTPLNNIVNVVRMLRSGNTSSAGRAGFAGSDELFEIILSSCGRITQQIEEALDYSRSEAGALTPHVEILNLGSFSAEIENSWRRSFSEKGLAFEVSLDEQLLLKCDRGHLLRIVDNLVSNALKYTDTGGVAVDGYQSKRGQVVRIDVSDSGTGFTPEQQARVFTPFERFRKEGVDGVGLGLSVTRSLVELNGGVIHVQSEPGRGTIVSVELPRHRPEEGKVNLESDFIMTTPLVGMVIEDDDDFRSLMSEMLSDKGIVMLDAASIPDAWEKVKVQVPAFVIADYSVPGGLAQLEALIQTLGSDVRVAIMSGYCLTERVSSAYKVFRKPFAIDEVLKWLESAWPALSAT